MNSELTETNLLVIYDNFSREQQRLMNELKNSTNDNATKHIQKEINLIHIIELSILKLKSLKKQYNDKIKNL